MKKSELRSIIREIISEQNTTGCKAIVATPCNIPAGESYANYYSSCALMGPSIEEWQASGEALYDLPGSTPQVGDTFYLPTVSGVANWGGQDYKVIEVSSPTDATAQVFPEASSSACFDPGVLPSDDVEGESDDVEGCTDPLYTECGNTQNLPCNNLVSINQDILDNNLVEGCNDSSATNYDPNATGCLAVLPGLAAGEASANQCGATYTGLTDPNNTDCCTYDSGADQKDPVGTTPLSFTNPDVQLAPKKTNQPSKGDMQKDRMKKLANIKPRKKK